MIYYFIVGFIYSLLVLTHTIYTRIKYKNRNTEYWVGTLIIGTLFYPLHAPIFIKKLL